MRYVSGGTHETGCIFCNRLAAADDTGSLIIHRGERCFVILNLFPYNTGHLMMVPNDHVAGPEQVDPAALAEMAELLPTVLGAVRRALRCDGFNIGINVGAVAGAGVADHLHQHVVPRWEGDANFMPILASTMVLPELLPVTYAKLRAELQTRTGDPREVPLVVMGEDDRQVLTVQDGSVRRLLRIPLQGDGPVWARAVDAAMTASAGPVELAGWAGSLTAVPNREAALALRAQAPRGTSSGLTGQWSETATLIMGGLADTDAVALQAALINAGREPPV